MNLCPNLQMLSDFPYLQDCFLHNTFCRYLLKSQIKIYGIYGLTETQFLVQVPGQKKWLILGVSLSQVVESRDQFFLEAEVVDNISQLDVLKNMRQVTSYADMFQAIRGLTILKIVKIRMSTQKFSQNRSFFSFSLKCFDLNCIPRKDTTIKIAWHPSSSSNILFRRKLSVFY